LQLRSPAPPLVIDLREPREYQRGHILQAQLISLPTLLSAPPDLPHDRPVALVCPGGRRSTRAATTFVNDGYPNVVVLEGGMLAWEAAGLLEAIDVAVGSTAYIALAQYEAIRNPSAMSRALQGLLAGIGFLGGAVIFKSRSDMRGIKTAAAIWITGAIGMAIGTGFWWLGPVVGMATAIILFVADRLTG
jgi:rhodanese-related sulfurtransferase